jgi:hypothetical protein
VGEYRLILFDNGRWQLDFVTAQNDKLAFSEIARGAVGSFDTTAVGSNAIRLIAVDGQAYFYVNDQYTATLDVSHHQVEDGTIAVGTGFVNGNEVEGKVTRFTDFTLRPLP